MIQRSGAGEVSWARYSSEAGQRLAEGVTADRDPVLQHRLGLAQGERIAFDGVGVIGGEQARIGLKPPHQRGHHRTIAIQEALFGVDTIDKPPVDRCVGCRHRETTQL